MRVWLWKCGGEETRSDQLYGGEPFNILFTFVFVFYVCFLFCVFCAFVLFCVLILLLYIAACLLFLYKFTDLCHQVETQLQ